MQDIVALLRIDTSISRSNTIRLRIFHTQMIHCVFFLVFFHASATMCMSVSTLQIEKRYNSFNGFIPSGEPFDTSQQISNVIQRLHKPQSFTYTINLFQQF